MATILVADDDKIAREILHTILSRAGHEVITATNGQEAIEQAQQTRPDVILMDLTMPILMGWQATERIKSQTELAHIPIIAFTAYGLGSELDRAFRAGCSDFLSKPVDEDLVLSTIQACLTPTD